jgi:electron transfer flavoprotein beta subunit
VKTLVLIRQVPDAEARVRAQGGKVDLSGATLALDGMDEYGVEQALRIGGETVALAVGPARYEDAVRRALAMGIDRAVLVEADEHLDPVTLAGVIKRVVENEKPDLVLVGGQHADTDSQAVGPAVAEALGWPQAAWTTALELADGSARLTHDTDDGRETIEITLPAVVTTQQGLNEPRYPTLPNIMKAKKKELLRQTLADLGGTNPRTRIVDEAIQDRSRIGKVVDGAKDPAGAAREVVGLLRQEAKVI